MAEINVKVTELSNVINKLQGLQSKCSSEGIMPPSTVGGGKVINELEDMVDVYKALDHDFAVLISNTISFLQNVKSSYMESDVKASNNIRAVASIKTY